jgi:pimeloyl-ACP methyl ester carboxylesterase
MRLFWLFLLIPLVPVAGALYQWLGARRDRRKFLRLGTLIDVGKGRSIYVSQAGSGCPAVVFESGIAATSQNWTAMQQSVSSFARTFAYDRGGLGWSSPHTSSPTPAHLAPELHLLLRLAGVPPPYVMVGHSFGSLVVRRFAADYPGEVAGLVLVDSMRPEEWPPASSVRQAHLDRGIRLAGMGIPVARFGLARLATTSQLCRSGKTSRLLSSAAGDGGVRVLDRIACEVGKMPPEVWPVVAAHWSAPAFYRGLRAHLRAVPETVREMLAAAPVEGIPIVLLTAGNAEPLTAEELRRIGPGARQIIAAESGHWVHLDQHELVLTCIRDMVEEVRSMQKGSTDLVAAGNEAALDG